MTYKKLVRDNIPEIIKQKVGTPQVRVLSDDEYKTELLKKLVEEANELLESPGDLNERADVAEVLRAIDLAFELDADEIEKVRKEKAAERGAFTQKVFLEDVA